MLSHNFSYQAVLADSLKVNWQVDDLIGGANRLDFSRPFLPEALAGVRGIECLNDREKLLLNQIRGNSYLYLFGFVEEFILPFAVDEARAVMPGGDPVEYRALVGFADEEAKHIHLFRRFGEAFASGFATPCGVIGPAAEVAKVVLSHSRLGVALLTMCLEWMTQSHYVDAVKDDQQLDPLFKSLLRHHWMEEAQHAKIDTMVIDRLATAGGAAVIGKALEDFGALGAAVDGLLGQQVQLDLTSLETAIGRTLSAAERDEIAAAQTKAYRYTFLVSGLNHKNFLGTIEQLAGPAAVDAMRATARALS
ncbi:MAG TPA: hypothetical protein VL172_02890 [Kofleriaceae bacterium]|jgi:hypothetical protein|nr:hypothetical protein [Kofleriaceae bacterium]